MYYQQMDDLGALGEGVPPGGGWETSFGPAQVEELKKGIQQAGASYRDILIAKAVAQQRPPTQIVQYPGAGQMMPGYGPGYTAPPMATSTKWLLGIGAVLLVGAGVMYYTKRKKAGAPAASNPRDDDYNDGDDDDGGGWKTIGA